jgi:hypothetical protein
VETHPKTLPDAAGLQLSAHAVLDRIEAAHQRIEQEIDWRSIIRSDRWPMNQQDMPGDASP